MARPIKRLETEPAVKEELRRRLRSRTCLVRERERAEIILLRLEGIGVAEIAARLRTTAKRVSTWSKRFETRGLDGLEEAAGRGRKPSLPVKKIESIVTEVTRPPKGRSRWSVRSMATPRRRLTEQRATHLVKERLKAARCRDVQAVKRSKI
jgi:hypothetical protein